MSDAPNTTVLAPAFYPLPTLDYSTRYLRLSAQRHNVPIHWYGEGEPYRNWHQVQIDCLIAELGKVETDWVLYTDSSDALLLSDLNEIEDKYVLMGCPSLLLSWEADGICAGGWMGWTRTAKWALNHLCADPLYMNETNPQIRWRKLVAAAEVPGMRVDFDSGIFQVVGSHHNLRIDPKTRRIINVTTGTVPSIAHFAGGYTDPEVGKAALIDPMWRSLGYE